MHPAPMKKEKKINSLTLFFWRTLINEAVIHTSASRCRDPVTARQMGVRTMVSSTLLEVSCPTPSDLMRVANSALLWHTTGIWRLL